MERKKSLLEHPEIFTIIEIGYSRIIQHPHLKRRKDIPKDENWNNKKNYANCNIRIYSQSEQSMWNVWKYKYISYIPVEKQQAMKGMTWSATQKTKSGINTTFQFHAIVSSSCNERKMINTIIGAINVKKKMKSDTGFSLYWYR